MRILLIDPVTTARGVGVAERRRLRQGIGYPGLGLLTIAALTPPEIEVRYLDESVEDLDPDAGADLVGITVQAPTANYAYELAESYRRRGIPTVLGGIHASLNPEEAAPHADSVVIGEGDRTWPALVEDFRRGTLRPVYRADGLSDLDETPAPRRDLLRREDYQVPDVVQASKSCPIGCEFCALHAFTGYERRFRTVARVADEVRAMPGSMVLFADDNLYANREFTLELARAMRPLRKRWVAEATWQIAYDDEVLEAARASGCVGFFIGFDSVNPQQRIAKVPRNRDVDALYVEAIRRIQARGMATVAAFVFGLDNDDVDVFERSVDVVRRGGANLVNFSALVPYPGTPIFRRLRDEGRITEWDWSRYVSPNVCFEPRRMSARQLSEGTQWAQREFYSLSGLARTTAETVRNLGWGMGLLGLRLNLAQRRNWGRGSAKGTSHE
ncbi:MAG TPA: radical SAM protein [Candidatus Eisenbacteria bacterium]|nr:radical SAM protein [Candidatus Eisenbacteria bacterium]